MDKALENHLASQEALLEFLRNDLSIANTMLRTARLEDDNPERRQQALSNVADAIEIIRRLTEKVEDPLSRDQIRQGTVRLEVDYQKCLADR